jgi:hypothetical protein
MGTEDGQIHPQDPAASYTMIQIEISHIYTLHIADLHYAPGATLCITVSYPIFSPASVNLARVFSDDELSHMPEHGP